MFLNQNFISNLFTHVQTAVAWIDFDRVYQYVNPLYAELMGKKPEELTRRSIYELFPDAEPFFESIFEKVETSGQPHHAKNIQCHLPGRGKNERGTHLDGTIWPMRTPKGEMAGFLISIIDITEQLETQSQLEETITALEEEHEKLELDILEKEKVMGLLDQSHFDLAAKNLELEQADQHKTHLLTYVSHEFRTPLNIILGYAQLLHEGKFGTLTVQQEDVSGRIVSYARTLSKLVETLLDLSRVKDRSDPILTADIDLRELLSALLASLRPLLRKRKVQLKWRRPKQFPMIVSDPIKLRRIFFNLVSNAIKFMQHGTLTVTLKEVPAQEKVVVSFSDTGMGINSDHLARIFDDFFHLTEGENSEAKAAGIGLATIKRLLDEIGGKIEVKNLKSQGSIFTVSLPYQLPGQNKSLLDAA
jgi:PAS domain S-box-containing protein